MYFIIFALAPKGDATDDMDTVPFAATMLAEYLAEGVLADDLCLTKSPQHEGLNDEEPQKDTKSEIEIDPINEEDPTEDPIPPTQLSPETPDEATHGGMEVSPMTAEMMMETQVGIIKLQRIKPLFCNNS